MRCLEGNHHLRKLHDSYFLHIKDLRSKGFLLMAMVWIKLWGEENSGNMYYNFNNEIWNFKNITCSTFQIFHFFHKSITGIQNLFRNSVLCLMNYIQIYNKFSIYYGLSIRNTVLAFFWGAFLTFLAATTAAAASFYFYSLAASNLRRRVVTTPEPRASPATKNLLSAKLFDISIASVCDWCWYLFYFILFISLQNQREDYWLER